MENIEQRLHRLSEEGCRTCGFTINNAEPQQQDRFVTLLEKASELEILALTELPEICQIKDNWLRSQAEAYRAEKKIEQHPERVAYFYEHTLPALIKALPLLPQLKEVYLFNVKLSDTDKKSLANYLKKSYVE